MEQELLSMFEYRQFPFSRDVFTLDEVRSGLPSYTGIRSTSQLVAALSAIGAQPLGQQRTKGSWRFSYNQPVWIPKEGDRQNLWVVDNLAYWDLVPHHERAVEYARMEGLYYPPLPDSEFWKRPLGAVIQ